MACALSGARCLIIRPRARPDFDDYDACLQKKVAPRQGDDRTKQEIKGISCQSRLNLARKMSLVSTPATPYHVTLTYGKDGTWPTTKDGLAAEKHRLVTMAKRAGLFGFWRLEFQRPRSEENRIWEELSVILEAEYQSALVAWMIAAKGGRYLPMPERLNEGGDTYRGRVPHWHLLVYDSTGNCVQRLSRAWAKTNAHQQGFFVTPGEPGLAMWYLALHQQKKDEQSPDIFVGRWWGMIDKQTVSKWSPLEQVAEFVNDAEVIWMKRMMRRKSKSRGSLGTQGFTWFLPQIQHTRVLGWAARVAKLSRDDRLARSGAAHVRGPF